MCGGFFLFLSEQAGKIHHRIQEYSLSKNCDPESLSGPHQITSF